MTILSFTGLIAGLVLFLVYLLVLLISNSLLPHENRNALRNSYPYQFYMNLDIRMRGFLYVIFGLMVLAISVGECSFFLHYQTLYMNILAITFPLSILLLGISNLLSLEYDKAHVFSAVAGFFLFSASALLYSVSTAIPDSYLLGDTVSLPISVLVGILGGLIFLGLANPKMMDWAKMDKAEENGKVFYVKPKVNFFALHEWICLFFMQGTAILLLIQQFLMAE